MECECDDPPSNTPSAFYGYGSNIITRSDHVSNDVWQARNLSASHMVAGHRSHRVPNPPTALCGHISRCGTDGGRESIPPRLHHGRGYPPFTHASVFTFYDIIHTERVGVRRINTGLVSHMNMITTYREGECVG